MAEVVGFKDNRILLMPFESVDGKIDTASLLAGKFTFPANEAKNFSNEFLNLIKQLLTADVNKYFYVW